MKKCIIFLFCCIIPILADENKETFQMPTVTEHHKLLAEGVGEWHLEQKMWFDPTSKEPVIATGTSICKSVVNGLVSLVHVETKSPLGTFKGFGVFTWNIAEKKYECTWVDVYSYYGLDSMEGTYDPETKKLTWTGVFKDPQGNEAPMTMVERWDGKDKMISEFFVDMGGQKIKTMVNTYTRIHKTPSKKEEIKVAPPKKEVHKEK